MVYSGEYRYDGKLLVAADALCLVSIFDAYQPRNLLVSISPSSHPSHVAKFHPTIGNQLVTGSDDRVMRVYDISQSTSGPIVEFDDSLHNDYIRSCAFVPGNSNLITTGCYDGVIRLFDTRQQDPIAKFDQGSPVEDVLALTPTTLVSAGGPQVKVWDLAKGSQIREFTNFTKTATSLHDAGSKGLLVGSLDGHVKIFDYSSPNWDVKFGWKFASGGVLSTAVSPNYKHFATGLTSGLLSIRTRKTEPKSVQQKQKHSLSYARAIKGNDYTGDEGAQIITTAGTGPKKITPYERNLRGFRWAEALDTVVGGGYSKEQVVTVMHELKKRGKIRAALYGRDESSLMPIVQWCIKNLEDVRYFNVICDYLAVIFECYGHLLSKSVALEEAFNTLSQQIRLEVRKCKDAKEMSGMLELLAI